MSIPLDNASAVSILNKNMARKIKTALPGVFIVAGALFFILARWTEPNTSDAAAGIFFIMLGLFDFVLLRLKKLEESVEELKLKSGR